MPKGKFAKSLLDMAANARMKRAQEMGFDTKNIYHHGTTADFNKFDLSYGGQNFGDTASQQGVFSATNREFAESYGSTKRLLLRSKNPKVINAEKALKEEYEYLVKKNEFSGDFESFIDEFTEGNPYGFYEGGALASDLMEAKAKGHDSAIIDFGNLKDPHFGKIGKVSVSFDPKNIRDVEAAFDPAKSESANLLAGALPAAIGVGATLKSQDLSAQEFKEPKGTFAKDLLADYINNNPASIAEMMFSGGREPSIEAPRHKWAADAAIFSRRYNQERKKRVHPILDMLLPAAELPADYLEKLSYGDKITASDRAKAALGLM